MLDNARCGRQAMRVLLVEDDELIAHGITSGLRARGLTVDSVATAAQVEAADSGCRSFAPLPSASADLSNWRSAPRAGSRRD